MQIYATTAKPININHEEVKMIFWQNPKEALKDMSINPKKYTNGFKSSIKIILDYLNKSKK